MCAHECSVHRGQKRASDALKLELQVVSCQTGLLVTELRLSARAEYALHDRAIIPARKSLLVHIVPNFLETVKTKAGSVFSVGAGTFNGPQGLALSC